ncbi:hypothetical protein K1X12_12770 [Hyphomonas sp. WL0036]|uniref:hypothetical protein n=1 Tax=Hyphomonas sediminis TaxID=2866160 RepID=UPI001C8255EF|nr:hypothetical protein [Hyphomonas sediminis]MBY9067777.1 hypothetical protein [Hyphomonas sediminis]
MRKVGADSVDQYVELSVGPVNILHHRELGLVAMPPLMNAEFARRSLSDIRSEIIFHNCQGKVDACRNTCRRPELAVADIDAVRIQALIERASRGQQEGAWLKVQAGVP